jgi:hypothetical protein
LACSVSSRLIVAEGCSNRTQALQFLALPIVVSHAGAKLIDFRFEGMGALYS